MPGPIEAAQDGTLPAPGWYGKLPSLGDFASRRLSHELIESWDCWLAEELGELRQNYPDEWLQGYLDSPTWRFVLSAGLLGPHQPQPMAGVLMPSVDRVGRYFPLTIMAPLDGLPIDAAQAEALFNWLHALDDIAADAMQDDWPIEELDAALAACPTPRWPAASAGLASALSTLASGEARLVAVPLPDARSAMAHDLGQALWTWGMHGGPSRPLSPGLAWWWSEQAISPAARQTLLSRGLPSGHDFSELMGPVRQGSILGDTAPSDHHAA